MKPFGNHDDPAPKSVPEMIQELQALYEDMSADPALAMSARHIRSALLALENLRRIAYEVYLEEKDVPLRQSRRHEYDVEEALCDRAMTEWLMSARVASPWKN
ncbi:MAG: hypothetical protein P8Y67_15260 [Alphaproteobacteria bacterium]|jgi:hypothetical protein